MKKKDDDFVRTTVYIPKDLYIEAKLMALYTNSGLSQIMRIALTEKIKKLKESVTNVSISNKI